MMTLGESILEGCFAVAGLSVSIGCRWRSVWLNVALVGFSCLLLVVPLAFLAPLSYAAGSKSEEDLLGWIAVFRTIGFTTVVIGFVGALRDLGRRINLLEDSAYAFGPRIPAAATDADALRPWNERNEGSHDIQK
jgi:hypothetical protein